MSNQVSLTLRPPPNVDHVDGFPGIPPGPNRPHAAVRGSIELRTGPAGVKAKWVRVELRKVETLPGGGQANTYFDFVGPSPVTLWQANPDTDYGLLGSRDFQFNIRIPESTPPSVNLASDRSGISYELVASVCTKGKRGFLRKRKSVVVSSNTGIMIDKHELHSTWPIYNQSESRQVVQDGVTLNVDRTQSCFGPGDQIAVTATVRSDAMSTVILRGFEVQLKETSIFRAGPYNNSGKKAAPQPRQILIAESKVPVNATLYGGNSHTNELSCALSDSHTTTTLSTARHIDIQYMLCVKALMGNGSQIVMDIPVIISNWTRGVSIEALRIIGHVPTLSLNDAATAMTSPSAAQPQTFSGRMSGEGPRHDYYSNTAPTSASAAAAAYGRQTQPQANEFGVNSNGNPMSPTSRAPSASATMPSSNSRSRVGSNTQSRLAIVNDVNGEVPASDPYHSATAGGSSSARRSPGGSKYQNAEDEKKMLYERAKAEVDRVQGAAARGSSPPPQEPLGSVPAPVAYTAPPKPVVPTASLPSATPASATPKKQWPTAEEEKALYSKATAAVERTQGGVPISAGIQQPQHYRQESAGIGGSNAAGGSSSSSAAPVITAAPTSMKPVRKNVPYMTAEQEKAAMRRYEEARYAVERTQNGEASPPAVDEPPTYGGAPAPAPTNPNPPAFSGGGMMSVNGNSGGSSSAFSEKERLRLAYERQDAQAAADVLRERQQQQRQRSPPPPSTPPYSPPAGGGGSSTVVQPVLSEKEALRRKYEAEEKSRNTGATPLSPTPNGVSVSRQHSAQASIPSSSPAPSGPGKILTAVEEKAMLAARYGGGGSSSNAAPKPTPPTRSQTTPVYSSPPPSSATSNSFASPTTPPPLKPRPPKEYIQETQEEDERVSRVVGDGVPKLPGGEPFTPFGNHFDVAKSPTSPPPMPGLR
ncbi:hypothetical protein DL96DRAFT_1720553 [Flagelloscypha sp. PMI_526]|nr:hypothetical protein DL96DRAFT_1720553 [Flagelloscypha sp. PMI_526]